MLDFDSLPESNLGEYVDITNKSIEDLIEEYELLLINAFVDTQGTDISAKSYESMIDWLRTTDFYTAPASTRYHDSHPGGLLVHSLKVYNETISLLQLPKFQNVDKSYAIIAALVHDWCKIGYYESFQKNVKNESTGQWEKETAYRVNQKGIPLGHGVTSLYLAMRVMKIPTEVALAIRFHMGRWSICEPEFNELQKANSEYPMVYLIQFADQLACVKY